MIDGRLGPGTFVAIGGPSGVGKDSLIRYARDHLAGDGRFLFVLRTISRPPEATEDHISVDAAEFTRQREAGAFAISWDAHGLSYGLPRGIDDAIAGGRVAIANVSRTVLPDLQRRYLNVTAIAVTADPALLLDRLTSRGRESAGEIAGRASRKVEIAIGSSWIELSNSGALHQAGDKLVALLLDRASRA